MYMLNMLIFYSHVSLPEGMLIYSLLMAQLMLRNLHGGHCWDGENRPLLRLQGTADADGFSWRLIETNQSFHISGRSQNPQELLVHPKDGTVFWEKNRYEQMLMGVSEKSNSFLRKPWSSRLFLGKDTDFHLVGAWVWPRSMVFGTSARRGWHVRGQVFVTQT